MKRRCAKIEYLWHVFFPNRCLFCEKPIAGDEVFCPHCEAEQPLLPVICNRCQKPALECTCTIPVFSVFRYEEGAKTAVHTMKFAGDRVAAQKLAQLMADRLFDLFGWNFPFDRIVPVPMHKKDKKDRGFSQSEWLAKALSKQISVPCIADALKKIRRTKKQHTLSAQERMKNLTGAFAVNRPERIRGQRILLVDDVFTTGTTAYETAEVLIRAGALSVTVIVAAKTTFTGKNVL